jgi:hypothetical protein
MRHWWNQEIHEKSLSTYCFFVKCSIPKCLNLLRPIKWQTSIQQCIPLISCTSERSYFDAIDSKLHLYEHLRIAFPLLELAIWKSTICNQFGQYINSLTMEMKMQCRTNSLSMVNKIVPYVLPFLLDDDDGSNMVNRDVDDDDSDSDDNNDDNDSDDE